MEKDVINAAFGALFHDVGKIVQRSREDPTRLPEGFEKEGQPVHAVWTQKAAVEVQGDFKAAALHSAYHHQPEKNPADDKWLSTLIAVADKLSAGERSDEGPLAGINPPKQMLSIFDRLADFRNNPAKQKDYLPLKKLELNKDTLFPAPAVTSSLKADYEILREIVSNAVSKTSGDPETDLEQLLFALEQSTWCVPSSYYYNLPDVSLYDHARTTAAIAVCLSGLDTNTLQKLLEMLRTEFSGTGRLSAEQESLLNQPAALLIGGDISGIQKFIYTVRDKKAAQSLRGRSFFLIILTEAILRFVLREIGIPYTNVIYAGGGHFYILAPLNAEDKIPVIQEKITRILLTHFGASLYLALGYSKIPVKGFKKGNFSEYWNEMHQNIGLKKRQRYTELGPDMHQLLFTPAEHGGNQEDVCAVCGYEKPDTRKMADDPEGNRICSSCSSFADNFGKHLSETAAIQLIIGEPEKTTAGTIDDVLAAFGIGVNFFDRRGNLLGTKSQLTTTERVVNLEISDPETGWKSPGTQFPVATRRFYIANRVPELKFDEIQRDIDAGIQRLGALRMDVDNLGNLFQTGFGEGNDNSITISRLSTLSFQLSIFFEGYLKKLCEEHQNIYTVYTGGDDLFLIGPWQEITLLAARIQEAFTAFTCGNPMLSISGGMTFIHGKYPLRQAAVDAGEAEALAKNMPEKNAFAFLDEPWHWDDFAEIRQRKDLLKQVTSDKQGPMSLLQLLMDLDEQQNQSDGKMYGRWLWMGDYQFTRMISQYKNNVSLHSDLEKIHQEIRQNYYKDLHAWGKAARWAQLELRNSDERK